MKIGLIVIAKSIIYYSNANYNHTVKYLHRRYKFKKIYFLIIMASLVPEYFGEEAVLC